MKWFSVNIIMYALIFLAAFFVNYVERKDLWCNGTYSDDCGEDRGMPFWDTKPNGHDTCSSLISKIKRITSAEERTIKWRRAFILAVGLSFGVWILVATPGCLPPWNKFYLSVIIMFAVLYFFFNYYSYHISGVGVKIGKDLGKAMESKCL
jgi:hypothetical protein